MARPIATIAGRLHASSTFKACSLSSSGESRHAKPASSPTSENHSSSWPGLSRLRGPKPNGLTYQPWLRRGRGRAPTPPPPSKTLVGRPQQGEAEVGGGAEE